MLLTIVAALNELLQMLPEPAVMLGIQKSSRRKLEPTHARVKCAPRDGEEVGTTVGDADGVNVGFMVG